MRPGALWAGAAAILVVSAASAQPAPSQIAGDPTDPAAGRAFAMQACAACHVVGLNQPALPRLKPPAPSFFDVAKQPRATAAWLADYLLHRHRRDDGAYPPVTIAQAADIATYITELRRRR